MSLRFCILITFIFFIQIFCFAQEKMENEELIDYLEKKGYIKVSVYEFEAGTMLDLVYAKMTGQNRNPNGIIKQNVIMEDGIEYALYFVMNEPKLPNLLSVVYITTEEGYMALYKINSNIECKICTVKDRYSGEITEIFAFY